MTISAALITFSGISIGLTFLSSVLLSKFLSRKFKQMGMTGQDVHKLDKPVTAEMGGVAVVVAVAAGALILFASNDGLPQLVIAGLATVLLVGVIGAIDDIFSLRQRYKPFLVALMSVPLAYALMGRTAVLFPLLGHVSFGILYPLIVVPASIAISANLSNMLAGFNGLEAGCAIIAIAALTVLSAFEKSVAGILLGSFFVAGYAGFLLLNKYPAKIFPGDTGTLMAGAAIASIGLASGLEFAAVVVSIPAALDFTLKMLSRNPFGARGVFGNTTVATDGHLIPPAYPALSHAFMRMTDVTEKSLVGSILAMELVFALVAIVITISM